MGRRFHEARYAGPHRGGGRYYHGAFPRWLRRWWNKKERRAQNRALDNATDYDAMTMPDEKKVSNVFDWL